MSSDSSDEENLDLLKEAQDNEFFKDSMFTETPEISKSSESEKKENLPSQRTVIDHDAQFDFLKVTPEFRNHVAKKLAKILDDKLNKLLVDVEVDETPREEPVEGGVKLLSDSNYFLDVSEEKNDLTTEVIKTVNQQKAPRYKKLKVEVSQESLKEAVVPPEDILTQKEVRTWSTRSKATIYRYKKSKNGQLVLVEPLTE